MSPGNMGAGVAAALGASGYDIITCLKGRSDYSRDKAARANMRDVGSLDGLVAEADLILSILDPAKAVSLAEEIAAAMANSNRKPPFADCNATSPATAERLNGIITGAGAVFIDVGIIGGPPRDDQSPSFCTSGPDAALIDEFDGKGVTILYVGDAVGAGSAIKICNGAWTKGAFALYTAVMMAAEHYGFTEQLRPRLPKSQAGTVDKLDQAIIRLPALSGRYIGEMEQIAETFESVGLPSGFHQASAELFRILNETPLASERRDEIDPDRTSMDTLKIIVEKFHDMA
jgi:3-hydroxyisobutyrate dehydrogenase-like beta-hydroxyacid dehydrogenase